MDTFRRTRYAVTLLILVMALFVTAENALLTVNAAATISVSPSSGSPPIPGPPSAPGTTFTVSGSGFATTVDAGACTITDADSFIDQSSVACTINSAGVITIASFRLLKGSTYSGIGDAVTVHGASGDTGVYGPGILVIPQIVLSPSSAAAGVTVLFAGAGFGASDTCSGASVTPTPPVSAASCSEQPDGTLVGQFTVTGSPGSYFVTVTDSYPIPASAPFTTTGGPSAVLSPPTGPTGTTVTVSGSGWNSLDTSVSFVQTAGPGTLYASPATRTCTVSGGAITGCTFTVSPTAKGGTYTLTFTGSQGDSTTSQFEVTSTLVLSPPSGGPGSTVTFSGSGYAGASACLADLSAAPAGLIASVLTCSINAGGILSGSLAIKNPVSPGPYTVILTIPGIVVPGPAVTAPFTVSGPPYAILSPGSGPTGTTVTVTGIGWAPGDTSVSYTYAGPGTLWAAPATRTCTVSGGNIVGCSFTVTSTTLGGLYTLSFTGSSGDTATASFTVTSTLVLSPTSGQPGSTVLLSGSGYAGPTASCVGEFSSSPLGLIIAVPSCTISASGVLSGSLVISAAATAGPYTVVLTDPNVVPGPSINAAFTVVSLAPTITLNPTSGPVGTIVTVTGSGFASVDAGAFLAPCPQISSPTPAVIAPGTPGACTFFGSGVLAPFTFVVGSVPTGQYTIEVTGISTGVIAQAKFTVTTSAPKISLLPTSGPVGTVVTVSGSGFAPADAGSFAAPCPQISSPTLPGVVTGAGACTFTGSGVLNAFSFTVGSAPTGQYVIEVTGFGAGDVGQAVFTVTGPTITLTPSSGPDGTTVTVSGSNFALTDAGSFVAPCPQISGSTPTVVIAAGACTFTSTGVLNPFTFKIGPVSPGPYFILVTGITVHDVAQAMFTATGPTVTLNPTSGPVGATVLVSGSNFSPSDAGTYICISSTPSAIVTSATCTFSSSGSMTGSFQVVSGTTLGAYAIKITGLSGDTASAQFTVISPTPGITLTPSYVSPGATVAISGKGFSGTDTTCTITSTPTSVIGAPESCTIIAGLLLSTSFTVPPATTSGTYTVTVTGSPALDAASATLIVGSSSPVTLTPGAAAVGATVGVQASDTAGSPAGTCSISGSPVSSVGCSEAAGGLITGTFIVSNVAPGPYQIQVTGTSGTIFFGVFVVQGPFLQLSDPLAVGQAASGPIGTHVNISGSFFSLSDTTCTLSSPSNGNLIVDGACSFFAGTGLFSGFNNVTGSFVVGNVPEGQYVVQATGNTGDFAQAIFNVTAGAFIQLSGSTGGFVRVGQVASGPTGTSVNIEGSQFLPGDAFSGGTCTLSSPTSGTVIVNGACSFFKTPSGFVNATGSFVVGNVQQGQYVIEVSGSAGDSAQAVFNVTSGAFIQLSGLAGGFVNVGQVASGPTGTSVNIEGSQFLPGDAINGATCTVSSPTSGTVVVNGACSFFKAPSGFVNVTGSFVVGNVAQGQYVIEVSGSAGDSAQAVFSVTSGAFIQLSGSNGQFVKVGQVASGPVGTSVNIEGSQFLPNDALNSATCTLSSPTSGTVIVNGACSFFKTPSGFVNATGSFVVGNVQQGQYVIQVSGSAGDSAQAVFNVTAGAFIQLSGLTGGFVSVGRVASGPVGTSVDISGSQFLPGDAFSGATCTLSSPTNGAIISDGACSFFKASNGFVNATGSFIVGNVLPGQYVIQVAGSAGDSAQAIFSVTLGARITLSPGTASPGTHVDVNGTGFLPTDSSCTILSPGSSAVISAGCVTQLGTGVTEGSFIVGNVVPGQYVIQVSGNQGDSAQAVLNVTSGPVLTVTPVSGSIGSTISIHGTGFLTTDQSCSISSISAPNPILVGSAGCAITVGSGVVSGSFIIGAVSPGEYVIEVTGCSGNSGCAPSAGDFAQAVVSVALGAATLTLSPTSASEEATVTFIGTGLSPSDTACSVESFNGLVPDNDLITSPTCSITTPGIAQGTFVVGAYATSDIAWSVQVKGTPVNDVTPTVGFTVIPDVIVTPTSGTVNTVFTFTGSGFSSAATSCTAVTVPSFASPGCAISGNTGQVSGSVVVPAGTPSGTYGMMVTDSTGKTATGVFTVGTPSALVVLNPSTVAQGNPVGVAGFGFNPSDMYCTISAGNPVLFATPPPYPTCSIAGGYASGSFTVSSTAPGGYYLIVIQACSTAPINNVCTGTQLDFASNFLGVTLATTIFTYSTTTSTSSTTTAMTTTTTSVATSFSYSSTTYSTTGILFTTYSQLTFTTVSGQTTTTLTQATSTTQTQTTVTVSTTTAYTTVPCGPLPCGFDIQPAGMNPAPSIDSTGLLAALLLVIPMLLRRLFG